MNRKIIFLSAAGLLGFGAFAQSGKHIAGATTFGITAGVNWNTINGKNSTGSELDNKLKTGFNAGINAVHLPLIGW